MTGRVLGLIVCLLVLPAMGAAQPVQIGERMTVKSSVLGEERTILVRTPGHYRDGTARYPVLYLTDGDAQFLNMVATVDFLARNGRMPEMIVVGIGNTDRTRDLTPTKASMTRMDGSTMEFPTAGGADKFLAFISTELFPFIEGKYRTAPYRVFAGHSFGGLFAMHAFTTKPDTFNAYIAVAPSLTWDKNLVVRRTADLLKERRELQKTLVVTLGDEPDTDPALNDLKKILASDPRPAGFEWQVQRFDDDDHGSLVMRSHDIGLRKTFELWRLPADTTTSLAEVEQHYAKVSARMGYPVPPAENIVNNLGYVALQSGKIEEALKLFESNIRNYPDSANVYDSHGEALEAAGKLEQARDRYAEAVRRGEAAKDPLLDAFKQHLTAIDKKLKTSQ
jgi:predicted alpha/beta superfamily hydrolase